MMTCRGGRFKLVSRPSRRGSRPGNLAYRYADLKFAVASEVVLKYALRAHFKTSSATETGGDG
jgi:hypothetical protein